MISDKLGQSLKDEFLSICKKDICRDGIEELLGWVEESDFFYAPASTRFHGNYKYGLLEHSLNVYKALKKLVKQHEEVEVSDETLAISALFHDICKANLMTNGELVIMLINCFLMPLTCRFHMGGFDSAVKGGDGSISKAYELCPLAVLLHLADMTASYLMEDHNA